jgi:hypothetical protein
MGRGGSVRVAHDEGRVGGRLRARAAERQPASRGQRTLWSGTTSRFHFAEQPIGLESTSFRGCGVGARKGTAHGKGEEGEGRQGGSPLGSAEEGRTGWRCCEGGPRSVRCVACSKRLG